MAPQPSIGALSGAPAVLATSAVVDVAVQLLGWSLSVLFRTDKLYDFTASLTYVALALLSFFYGTSGSSSSSSSPRQVAATVLLVLWAARLGSFLLYRVLRLGGDSRFEEALQKPLTFLVYWMMQALWIFATASGTLWLNGTRGGGGSSLWATDIIGPLLFALGFAVEAVADAQKLRFRLDPSNRGKFIDSGLWSLARYPNYFGEIVLQSGLWLLCVPSFGRTGAWLTVLGPVFVALLLLFVSGIPLQEKQAQARWGSSEEFKAYRGRTRLLVPLPKKGARQ